MSALRMLVVLALGVVLTTCGDDGPRPDWLQVRLTAPAGADDAGVMFTVGGGPIDSVRSALPTLHAARLDESSWRVLVAGDGLAGVVAEIWVPDVGAAALYSGTVEQVAERGTLTQRAVAGYQIAVGQR